MRAARSARLAAGVTGVLVLSALLPAPRVMAADPVSAARDRLSRERGVAIEDLALVHERPVSVTGSGESMWAGKFLDARTGEIVTVYRTSGGEQGTTDMLTREVAEVSAARPAMERKADAALIAAVAGPPAGALPVAIWLDVDVSAAEASVERAHPEVAWLAGRPLAETIEQVRALRGELWNARRAVYAAAADELAIEVEALGGRIGYVSTSAPLVFVDLPSAAVVRLAARADVLSMGLESRWETTMTSAGPTIGADWTSGSGDQGNGTRVAVVEYHNASNSGDLSGQVVKRYSTTGTITTHIHPTWVAGAIGSRNSSWRGVAPGADIVSAGTGGSSASLARDRAIIEAADWSISPSGGDADIVNTSLGQDTSTGAEEARRYFDSIGWEAGRLVVAASGNRSTFGHWDVVSPGTGYNVLTVGGVNDRNTTGTGDDRLWYSSGGDGASYRDRASAPWNSHGDYNKPNVSAPAVDVHTANGTTGSGTSIASPIVAGIAAQLVARSPTLASWPEATRALIMAGAVRRTPLSGAGRSADHEGTGTVSARWSNRMLDNGIWGGYALGTLDSDGDTFERSIEVIKGQPVRIALAWSSHTSGGSNLGKSDVLTGDLDLVVRQPNGATSGSFSFDNSYEWLDVTANATGTMRIEVRSSRFDASQEPFGLAWAIQSPYTDSGSSKFYADILWLTVEGITVGCGPSRFCPSGQVTRAQMATFLTRALDLPATSHDYFSDDNGSTHEDRINAVAAAGITVGCGERRFCPDGIVTRAQMASFLVRALDLPSTNVDHFTDDNGSTHEDRINALAASGITHGCGTTTFCPNGGVTRGQMAAFLHRALAD
jgi:hypothetical protein